MVHEKAEFHHKTRAPMIRYRSQKQLTLSGFETPFQTDLDEKNRWIRLSELLPWDELSKSYYSSLSVTLGRPAKDARMVIAAVIIKHKLSLSDEETVQQLRENPYLQYFAGMTCFSPAKPFVPSLLVEIRKRMGDSVFEQFHQAILGCLEAKPTKQKPTASSSESNTSNTEIASPDGSDNTEKTSTTDQPQNLSIDEQKDEPCDKPTEESDAAKTDQTNNSPKVAPQGKLILDATVSEQAIRYPTDLNLLNESRELTEKIIDTLHVHADLPKKPRTYREKARKQYLAVVKQRRPATKVRRKGIKQQLGYLRRNIATIEGMLDLYPTGTSIPLPHWLMRRYWVIQHVYTQQKAMYQSNTKRCDDRIVSLSQPWVRPIVRGKLGKSVEFGAKYSVSLDELGLARVDHLRWNAFNEGQDLPSQVETYRQRHGHYPAIVLADPIYGSRVNRDYLKEREIRFGGKPLGRPKKQTEANKATLKQEKAERRENYRQRIPIEGKFGQGKHGYGLARIAAKLPSTSGAWINSIFFVMNLLVLQKALRSFFALLFLGAIQRLHPIGRQTTLLRVI